MEITISGLGVRVCNGGADLCRFVIGEPVLMAPRPRSLSLKLSGKLFEGLGFGV